MLWSFRDPVTGVLITWGATKFGRPGDIRQEERDDFALAPGRWQWDGAKWVGCTPPLSPLAQSLDTVLADAVPNLGKLKALLSLWRGTLG